MITYDEDDFFPELWKRNLNSRFFNENKVYTIFLGKGISPNTSDNTPYNHYSILATLKEQWGLSGLGAHEETATPFIF